MDGQLNPNRILQTGLAFWPSKTLLERRRIRRVHRARARSAAARHAHAAAALASAFGTRFSRHAGRARLPRRAAAIDTRTRRTPICSSTRTSRRMSAASSRWPTTACIRSGASSTEALRTGEPQNEVKGGGPGMFETLYADPARLKEFLAAMTGISHGANMTIARKFPWAGYKTFVDVGTAQGDLGGADRAGQSAPDGHRLRPAAGPADLRRVRGRSRRAGSREVRGRRLLQGSAAEGRRRPDGPHPARLGSADEEDADQEGLSTPCPPAAR